MSPLNGERPPALIAIENKLRWLLAATALVYVIVIGVSIYGAFQADKLHDGVCTFVDDLDARVQQGEAFLEDNPQGFGGIDQETLRTSIINQKRTANVLRAGVGC